MKQKMKELQSKRGFNTLEMIAIVIIFLTMFGFFLDTFNILNQHYVASREANIVTRQLAVQGGVTHNKPYNYDRYGQKYVTVSQLQQRVLNNLDGVGTEPNAKLYVTAYGPNRAVVKSASISTGDIIQMEYQQPFTLQLSYEYKWQIMGQMIPGMGGVRTRHIERSSVSETALTGGGEIGPW